MIEIRKIYKRDVIDLLNNKSFWNHPFLAISKHRLLSHSKNPNSNPDDIVLLLAYLDGELVGYMGLFIDEIILDSVINKIGWLSTWWVHPKTKGTGIGREILDTMYMVNNGKIGISQFTPSARRVYDKSGYFTSLKENKGIKAVLKSDFNSLIPKLYPKTKIIKPFLNFFDSLLNSLINIKLFFQKIIIENKLNAIKVEYLNSIDYETNQIINKFNMNHISKKTNAFFEWLKANYWVQEAPLLELTEKNKYEFSMCDTSFNIYLIKIIENKNCIGFLVLQKRNKTIKVLFAYYDKNKHVEIVSNLIKLHCINQKVNEVICYDESICNNLKKSNIFIYKRKKIKHSIISKDFKKNDFEDVFMNFGDGDCCFA